MGGDSMHGRNTRYADGVYANGLVVGQCGM